MNTKDFKEKLIEAFIEKMSHRLYELADASIEAGVEQYCDQGYITLDFKGEFDSHTSNKMLEELSAKGLDIYDCRCISDTAWNNLNNYLVQNGWKVEPLLVDNENVITVKM